MGCRNGLIGLYDFATSFSSGSGVSKIMVPNRSTRVPVIQNSYQETPKLEGRRILLFDQSYVLWALGYSRSQKVGTSLASCPYCKV